MSLCQKGLCEDPLCFGRKYFFSFIFFPNKLNFILKCMHQTDNKDKLDAQSEFWVNKNMKRHQVQNGNQWRNGGHFRFDFCLHLPTLGNFPFVARNDMVKAFKCLWKQRIGFCVLHFKSLGSYFRPGLCWLCVLCFQSLGSRYGSGRYSSAADRPSSYSEYSRSTPALDTDYKKVNFTINKY